MIADDVEIGPFCIVGPDVTLGPGSKLLGHVTIHGITSVGKNNIFHPNCVIGGTPQDLKYRGEPTRLEIGDENHIREAVTIHTGTDGGGGVTRVGNRNLLMVNVHVGHDVQIGDHCIIANNVMLAGHIMIGNHVVINGGAGVTAFTTIGDFSYAAAFAQINHDVPPYMKVSERDQVRSLNTVGLQRRHPRSRHRRTRGRHPQALQRPPPAGGCHARAGRDERQPQLMRQATGRFPPPTRPRQARPLP